MAAQSQGLNNNPVDLFDAYFRRADLDGDGRISGAEAVAFFRASNLPQNVLAQVWNLANQNRADSLGRAEFYNALKLVTVAQSKRDLTPEIVQKALYGPASASIPAPQINLAALPAPQLNPRPAVSATQLGNAAPRAFQNMAIRRPQMLTSSGMSQSHILYQQNQPIRPSQSMSPGIASSPQQAVASLGFPGVGNVETPHLHNSSISTNWPSDRMGPASQIPSTGLSPSTMQDGFGQAVSGFAPPIRSKSSATTVPTTSAAPKPHDSLPSFQVSSMDSKAAAISGNGDVSQKSSTPFVASSIPASTAIVLVSSGSQTITQPSQPNSLQSSFTAHQPVGVQIQKVPSSVNQNQQVPVQNTAAFAATTVPLVAETSSGQSHLQWPRMTQSDVQKYKKVFLEVDTDRDGKISGAQARNLFLSWRLPREILKQVWDLSDQDNDSMLSLREFCIALYLMERYREGCSLPVVLPSNIMFDETLLRPSGQTTTAYGPQQQGLTVEMRPPSQIPVTPAETTTPTSHQKSRVPVLEKHLVDQLSTEEQNFLNSKFQEATEADKKVEELEKEILDSKQKIEFYRNKMQEIILYKSKCDNRLNEIMERASADKREVDLLMKRYEERYKQAGDVASHLTVEEATFRDIQEKKMELYQAIVKMEQASGSDDNLQVHADRIRSELEDLVKTLNERCKKYGLRGKPTTLVELPFGWQRGIQDGAADWDEDWDKLEDEGFSFVKELTLDVLNIIAPPKARSFVRKESVTADEGVKLASSMDADGKSEKISSDEQKPENGSADLHSRESLVKSPPDSPAERSAMESPSQEWQDSKSTKSIEEGSSPLHRDTQSDHGGADSVVSVDKNFDEPSWGAFDTHYDTESIWGFNSTVAKDIEHERLSEHSFFDSGPLGLNPIRTNSLQVDDMFQKKSAFTFADSVPSTPAPNFGNSPSKFSEMSEDHSFNNFSRFDSFSMNDSGFFPSRDSLARFDSIRSSRDSDVGHGFPSFDDTDPFGSSGLFKPSLENQTPRKGSDNWSAF